MKNINKNKPITDQEFDAFFKTQLEDHQVHPKAFNWFIIQGRSFIVWLRPLVNSPVISGAAAAFILLVTSIHFSQMFHQSNEDASISVPTFETPFPPATVSNSETKNSLFVLDLPEEPATYKEEKIVREALINKEIDDYLAFLLEDEHEFSDKIDADEIALSLRPVEQLPIDEMFTYIPEIPAQEEYTILSPLETRITLPHRFVESDQEVEDFLTYYELNQKKKKRY